MVGPWGFEFFCKHYEGNFWETIFHKDNQKYRLSFIYAG